MDADYQSNQYVYEFCTYQIESISNTVIKKFYETEYEKLYLLGKMKAYEDIVQLIQAKE